MSNRLERTMRQRWFLPVAAFLLFALLAVAMLADLFLPAVVIGNVALIATLVWLGTAGLRAERAAERAAEIAAGALGLARTPSAEGERRGYPCDAVARCYRAAEAPERELVLLRLVRPFGAAHVWMASATFDSGATLAYRIIGAEAALRAGDENVPLAALGAGACAIGPDRAAAPGWVDGLSNESRAALRSFLALGGTHVTSARVAEYVRDAGHEGQHRAAFARVTTLATTLAAGPTEETESPLRAGAAGL